MVFARYRNPAPSITTWPGEGWTVGLLPLPLRTICEADSYSHSIRERFTGQIGEAGATLAAQCYVLHKALVTPVPPYHQLAGFELLQRSLSPLQAHLLFERWMAVQAKHVPDVAELEVELLRRMREDASLLAEGAVAYGEGIEQVFAKPVNELTIGQVGYFVALRSAYSKGWGTLEPGATRAISRRAMEGNQ